MTRFARTATPVLLAIAALTLAACATPAPEPSSAPEPEASCEVAIVVDFGPLDEPSVEACGDAGAAKDILAAAGITTEGTVDYGDQVVCRVNDQPSPDEEVTLEGQAPFVETCQTLNAAAYWALWVKNSPEGEWEYAQEGVSTLQLTEGQSVGLVYTAGTDSVPPQD